MFVLQLFLEESPNYFKLFILGYLCVHEANTNVFQGKRHQEWNEETFTDNVS